VHETRDDYVVLVDLPGVMPTEVHVYVEDKTLVVHGRRTSQEWTKLGEVIYAERFQGDFVRRIPLPGAVNPTQLKFSFKQGLLQIQISKLGARSTVLPGIGDDI
jgi:HSP20 family protein